MRREKSFVFIKTIISLFLFLIFTASIKAQVNPSSIFSSGMVLQREHTIPVWGSASANATVKVKLESDSVSVQADSSGKWKVELPARSAGGPYSMIISSGTQTLTRTNVYVGDVWLASGQSNMEFTLSGASGATSEIAAANDQMIRQFKVQKALANEPSNDLPTGCAWTPATSQYAGSFTAVGYYFAKYLKADLGIPIGILNISYGGSRIEAWMSDAMLGFDEQTVVLGSGEAERQPTVAFNKMIYPILQFPIKGVIWYQGESNADNVTDAMAYSNLFKTFINGWRELFGLGDIPFLWVQLPNYGTVYDEPQSWDAWPQLRAGQTSALALPNTGEAITIDVGGTDIHPTQKQPVGYRISLVARKVAYNEDIIYQGPRYLKNSLRADGKVEVDYNFLGSGLKAKDSLNGAVSGFAIAGSDDKFVWASAVIEDDHVVVWNDNIAEPETIRYAWEFNPVTNLYNIEDLPAAPFLALINPGFKIFSFSSARSAIESGQSTTLSWHVFGASSVALNGTSVDTSATITITPAQTTTYTLIAVNRNDANDKDTSVVTVEVLDPNKINRALNHTATASTYEACCGANRTPNLAVDGDLTTRWSSAWQKESGSTIADPNLDDNPDDEWIAVDLGESIDIERIIITWEAAYASTYNIEFSYDGYLWNKVYEELSGNGGEDNIVFSPTVSGRFIRIHGLSRATQYGYSIYEIAAYGTIAAKKPPTVSISSSIGNVTKTGTQITFTATTTDADGTVQQAVFYADDQLINTDDASPFEAVWTPSASGEYNITAVVTDNDGQSVQSAPFTVHVDDGTMEKYEAENATYTGTGSIKTLATASGGKYRDMQDGWTLTFSNVDISSSGEYLLVIGYQLTYDSPKTQYLVINGDTIQAVEFVAPNKTSWLQLGIKVNLNAGINEIAFRGFWNWMSMDYIAIIGDNSVGVKEQEELPSEFSLAQNYPNPFNPSTNIIYSLPGTGHVKLEIYNIVGQRIATLLDAVENAGTHKIGFNGKNIASGVYFYRIIFNSKIITKSMILLR